MSAFSFRTEDQRGGSPPPTLQLPPVLEVVKERLGGLDPGVGGHGTEVSIPIVSSGIT